MSQAASSPPSSASARRRLGELALEQGLITAPQLKEALAAQGALQKLGLSEKIGQILFQKKFLTRAALDDLLRAQDDDATGKKRRLGNFEILEKVGQGAMGVVFKARQLSMDRLVALKILAPKYAGDPEFIERFVREARAAGQFNHEHIVAAVDVGFVEPYHYFAMEYVQGVNLRQVIKKEGALEEVRALKIALQVAQALDHALSKGIIHRDIKPDNVMLDERGMAKLLDLGLATAVAAESQSRADLDAVDDGAKKDAGVKKAVGTPHYMSPEAARGIEDLDTRADIYSLGCTLYHLLTGSTPFDGVRSREVMARHVVDRVPDVRERNPQLGEAAARIVAKATAREREARYANPAELAADLEAVLSGREPPHASAGATPSPKESGSRGRTTGPRKPVGPGAKTTGPRVPIRGRGTTGPRVPVSSRPTTGPNAPVPGDRTGGISVSIGSQRAAAQAEKSKSGGKGLVLGLAGVGAVLLGLFALMSGGNGETKARAPAPPAAKTQAAPRAPVETPTVKVSKPEQVEPTREQEAELAFAAFEQLAKEKPDDFAALAAGLEQAKPRVAGTPAQEKLERAEAQAQARWAGRYARALDALKNTSGEALGRRDYAGALAALDEDAIPAELRAFDGRVLLEAERQQVKAQAEQLAARLLKQAEAQAAGGTEAGLNEALDLARQAQALPAELAPSAKAAEAKLAEWTKALAELKEKAEAQRGELAARTEALLLELQKELDPLLRAGRFEQALDALAQKRAPDTAVKSACTQAAADVKAILALRQAAVDALNRKQGEKLELKKGGGKLSGTIADPAGRQGVTLRLDGKMELTVTAAQLEAEDVDAQAPAPETAAEGGPIGGTAGEAHRRRALLFMAAGRHERAKGHFEKAAQAGLAAQVAPYLKRLAILELGEAEVRARDAWQAAEALFEAKKWKEAQEAFEAFTAGHGHTEAGKAHAAEAAERLKKIAFVLNPFRPGLLAVYFKGRDFREEDKLLSRVEQKVDTDWGGGAPDPKVPGDGFCARWTGFVKIAKAGEYTFITHGDDGVRLWIGDKQVTNDWSDHATRPSRGTLELSEGYHSLRFEYYENGGGACCRLHWSLKDGFNETAVPPESLWRQPAPGEPAE
ncbi:MAG: protein kinase [Planctomycetota bacterium]|nr:protein kinase [Planctomycetota bacterium]